MGYSIMISKKDTHFLCQESCEHTDCKALREFVKNAKCQRCQKRITAGQKYYEPQKGELEHASCVKKY